MTASQKVAEHCLLEKFELRLIRLAGVPERLMEAPVVDGWLQLNFMVSRPPTAEEEVEFLQRLSVLVDTLRSSQPIQWFFLHKAPGLRLRIRGEDAGQAALCLAEYFGRPSSAWLAAASFATFFDQAELRPLSHRAETDALLSAAADALLVAAEAGSRANVRQWSEALATIATQSFYDGWIGFEALSRLRRLRWPEAVASEQATRLWDPEPLLAAWPSNLSEAFAGSVALLQALNSILNMWGLAQGDQAAALSDALELLRPDLLNPAGT